MEIRLLGALEVVDDAGADISVAGARLRSLLAALAIRPGQVISAERLGEELWAPGGPPSANALQAAVSKLRRILPEGAISTQGSGYMLDLPIDATDVGRFEALVVTGRKASAGGDTEAALRAFRAALSLWRGPALSEFIYEEWARSSIARLEEERVSTMEDRFDAELAAGGHGELVAELEALVSAEPLRERLRGQLMLALYRSGRQAEALGQYQEARRVLGEELGLDPGPELRSLEAAILIHDPGLASPVARTVTPVNPSQVRSNLRTPPTATVGRQEELERLTTVASTNRLVTLVGPGGIGKTRLAIETGRGLADNFRDGAWMVDLSPLHSADDVVRAITGALRIDASLGSAGGDGPTLRLVEVLAERELLLIVDNCEHLIDSSARVVDEILTACPRIHVLATSRERLGVAGEILWPVPPLGPEASAMLFEARALEVAPEFVVTDESSPIVTDICARLDGLPLAIELAAARLRVFPVAQVAARLDDRFRLLDRGPRTAAPRQQALRAAIDWSYDLLPDEERLLFKRLAVFADGCDLDAAEAVCSDARIPADDVTDLMSSLVDKSLVVAGIDEGTARFSMLQTLAEYAREHAAAGDELDVLQRRHAAFYRSLADRGAGALAGHDQRRWLHQVTQELSNLRLALDTAVSAQDADVAQAIAGGLGWYWWVRGHAQEGLRWLDAALEVPGPVNTSTRAWGLAWTAFLRLLVGGYAPAVPMMQEAISAFEQADDAFGLGCAKLLSVQLHAAAGSGQLVPGLVSEAREHFVVASAIDPLYDVAAHWCAALSSQVSGDDDAAMRKMRAFLARPDNTMDHARVFALNHLADMSEARGECSEAAAALGQARQLALDLEMRGYDPPILARLANLARLRGDDTDATALLTEAMEAARRSGSTSVLAATLAGIAARQLATGNLAVSAAAAAPAVVLCREADDAAGSATTLAILGWGAERGGDVEAATSFFTRAMVEAHRAEDPRLSRDAIEGLAAAELLSGRAENAARLLGAASVVGDRHDGALPNVPTITGVMFLSGGGDAGAIERIHQVARDRIGADAFNAAYASGADTGVETLVEERTR